MSDGTNVQLGQGRYPVHVWYDEKTSAIHVTCNDPQLTDENGAKPGFRVVFNGNPRSADYNPGNFNRLARYLRSFGKPAPDEVPLKARNLSKRAQVMAELVAEVAVAAEPSESGSTLADPAAFGWNACPSCSAIVLDLLVHRSRNPSCVG
jgi:hypothetical protein